MMPAVLGIAADAMGQTTEEFLKNMENGAIKSKEFLPLFTDALREMAAPGLDKAFKTMNVAFKRMTQNAKLFVKALFESGVGDIFTSIFNSISSIMRILQPLISLLGGFLAGVLKPILYTLEFVLGLLADFVRYIDELTGGNLNNWLAMFGEGIAYIVGLFGKMFSFIKGVIHGIGTLFRKFSLVGRFFSTGQTAGSTAKTAETVATQIGNRSLQAASAGTVGYEGNKMYNQKVAVEFTGEARDNLRQNKRESTVRTINTNSRP